MAECLSQSVIYAFSRIGAAAVTRAIPGASAFCGSKAPRPAAASDLRQGGRIRKKTLDGCNKALAQFATAAHDYFRLQCGCGGENLGEWMAAAFLNFPPAPLGGWGVWAQNGANGQRHEVVFRQLESRLSFAGAVRLCGV